MNDGRRARIGALNDSLRQTGLGGTILITQGIQELGDELIHNVIQAMIAFDAFTTDNDPHGEHDFGSVSVGGHHVFWKIDYYDLNLLGGSPDAADENVTRRVLTIMLASEY